MPKTTEFLGALEAAGYDFFTGVPCSLLKGVIRRFDEEPRWGYVSAVREDSAMGIAAGDVSGDGRLDPRATRDGALFTTGSARSQESARRTRRSAQTKTWRWARIRKPSRLRRRR